MERSAAWRPALPRHFRLVGHLRQAINHYRSPPVKLTMQDASIPPVTPARVSAGNRWNTKAQRRGRSPMRWAPTPSLSVHAALSRCALSGLGIVAVGQVQGGDARRGHAGDRFHGYEAEHGVEGGA